MQVKQIMMEVVLLVQVDLIQYLVEHVALLQFVVVEVEVVEVVDHKEIQLGQHRLDNLVDQEVGPLLIMDLI